MKQLGLTVLVFMFLVSGAPAVNVAGVNLSKSLEIAGDSLQLNGFGIRKKFFFKIYVGSLYTLQEARSAEQVLSMSGSKMIRMDFLYSKVDKEKITGAFAEGFHNNSPELSGNPMVSNFLSWFNNDFVEGDQVDLIVDADGNVRARHNDRDLGSLQSPELARGILLIYLGQDPADKSMKKGMLGG